MARRKSGDIRRRWELRVLVALPAVWVLFAAVEGYLTIQMTGSALGLPNALTSSTLDRVIIMVIGVGSVAALVLGAGMALAVTKPMGELMRKIQHRLHGDAAVSMTSGNEMRQLSNAFDTMLLSFEKFVSDTHIVDGMPIGIIVLDGTDRIVRANSEAERLLRAEDAPLEGRRLEDLCPAGMDERVADVLKAVRDGATPTEITSEVILGPEPGGGVPTTTVALHPTTTVGEVVVVIRDLKHLETIRGQMQRVDQLAALGAHMASLAHEIGGSLMGIQMLIEALEPRSPSEIKLHDKLRDETERAARLLTEIRTFGQASARERVMSNLGRLADEIVWMLEPRFVRKHITVERRIDVDLPMVLIDRDRIVQAILNIVTNAFEATPADGKVSVSVQHESQAIVLRIANTGSFIPPEERDKIFALFYTTKRGGSGFGLPQARRALADHGGEIELTSSREEGTAFTLRFPDQAAVSEIASEPLARPSVTQRVAQR